MVLEIWEVFGLSLEVNNQWFKFRFIKKESMRSKESNNKLSGENAFLFFIKLFFSHALVCFLINHNHLELEKKNLNKMKMATACFYLLNEINFNFE